MSRLIRLKEIKRKNRMKATACGLALALAIGSAQGLGTYALFADTEDVANNLAISTGDVDVEVSKDGFDKTELQPGSVFEHKFTVNNHGTLRQHITLKLGGVPNELKPYIKYNIKFDDNTELSTIFDLNDEVEKTIVKKDKSLFVLEPGKTINLTSEVIIDENMTEETQILLANKINKLLLKIKASQINGDNTLVNKGFYDVSIQENYLTIGEYIKNIITGNIKVTGHTVTIEFKDFQELTNNLSTIEVIEKSGTGKFEGATTGTTNSNKLTIEFPKSFDLNGVGSEFGMGNTVKIKFKYKDGTSKTYLFDFRKAKIPSNHSKLDAKYEELEPQNKESENIVESVVVEQLKEEVEKTAEPDVVEQLKGDIIEPQKQPEVIELPKDNEDIQE